MNYRLPLLFAALLAIGSLVVTTLPETAAQPDAAGPSKPPVTSLNFDVDTGDWKLQRGAIAKEELVNGSNAFARLEAKQGEMAYLGSPIWKISDEKFIELKFRYRSNVPGASKDVGSWAYIPWMSNAGQTVSNESIILPAVANWTEVRQRYAVPEGAAQLQVQLRLQNTGGQVDFDDVFVNPVSSLELPMVDEEPAGAELREVARWTLRRDGDQASLQGTSSLPAVPITEDPKALAFVLPDQYTERTDLIYDITCEFVPRWNVNESGHFAGLFVLGRNMHDYAPPAISMLVWDTVSLYSRVTSQANTTMQVIHRPQFRNGQAYRARSIVTTDTLTAYGNRKLLGQSTMASPFRWPKRKKFFVGSEDANLSPLEGDIKEFTLRIWTPRTRTAWAGGTEAGFFFGEKKPALNLQFPDANGLQRATKFSVVNLDGKTVFQGNAKAQSATQQSLPLPSLPHGWYQVNAEITEKGSPSQPTRKTSRSIVVLPQLSEREPAAVSPLGITEEITLREGTYSPAITEALFRCAAQMGVRWWRLWVQWDVIEPERGQFHWKNLDHAITTAKKYGLETYVCLQGGSKPWQAYGEGKKPAWDVMSSHVYAPQKMEDWARYVRAIGSHLKGKVNYWQVWNEPDARNGFYPFSTEKYVEVLRSSARVLRDVDPANHIGTGGFAGAFDPARIDKTSHTDADAAWGLGEFYALKPQNDFDILDNHFYSVHEAGQSWEPQLQNAARLSSWLTARKIKTRLWNSETSMYSAPGALAGTRGGWANVPYLTEKAQAQRLVEMHVQSLAAGIERTFWYGMRGDIGVINTDFSAKPSYAAHAILALKLNGMRYVSTLDWGQSARAYAFQSRTAPSRRLIVAWARNGNPQVRLPNGVWRVSDWMDNPHTLSPNQTTLQLPAEPLYIESK